MKTTLRFLILLIILFGCSTMTLAATTVFWGNNIKSNQTIDNDNQTNTLGNDFKVNVFSVNYLKKFRLSADYEFGELNSNFGTIKSELWDFELSYPVIKEKKGFLAVTTGYLNFSENSNFSPLYYFDIEGGMLGVEFVGLPHERVRYEIGLKQNLLGDSGNFNYQDPFSLQYVEIDSPLNMTAFKTKLQIVLSDHIGIVVLYRYLNIKSKDSKVAVSSNYNTVSAGLVYRF